MMEKYLIPIVLLFLLAVLQLFTSCRQSEKNIQDHASLALYQQTCELTEAYLDSVSSAPDSLQLMLITDRFESRMERLNMDVAPETDYRLSEDQNDTIARLIEKLILAKEARLKYFLRHTSEHTDSVGKEPD